MSFYSRTPEEERLMIQGSLEAAKRRLLELEKKRSVRTPLTRAEVYEIDGLKDLIKCAKRELEK